MRPTAGAIGAAMCAYVVHATERAVSAYFIHAWPVSVNVCSAEFRPMRSTSLSAHTCIDDNSGRVHATAKGRQRTQKRCGSVQVNAMVMISQKHHGEAPHSKEHVFGAASRPVTTTVHSHRCVSSGGDSVHGRVQRGKAIDWASACALACVCVLCGYDKSHANRERSPHECRVSLPADTRDKRRALIIAAHTYESSPIS